MAKTKSKGYDYSECTFRSLEPGPLPRGVLNMLRRSLESFGTDHFVLTERWTQDLGDGVTESIFSRNKTDIVCADLAAFVMQQTGACDHAHAERVYKEKTLWKHFISEEYKDHNFRSASYWRPTAYNADHIRLVKKSNRVSDFFNKDGSRAYDDWLPGDYFLYSSSFKVRHHPPDDPSHINVYIGPFQEEVDGELVGPVFSIINGSLGLSGTSNFVRPLEFNPYLKYYFNRNKTVWHCRVLAVERLYRQIVGVPLDVQDSATADSELPVEIAWRSLKDSNAPFPVGQNLTWHDGIHLLHGDKLASKDVLSFAPGEVVLARLAAETQTLGDTSFVLLRHWMNPDQLTIVEPPTLEEDKDRSKEGEASKKTEPEPVPFHSLYMHIAPISSYLDEKGAAQEGAPPWIQRLAPVPEPGFQKFIPADASVSMIFWTKKADDLLEPMVREPMPDWVVASDQLDYGKHKTCTVDGKTHYYLPVPEGESNIDAWSGKSQAPTVPRRSRLHYYNPETGETIVTKRKLDRTTLLTLESDALEVVASDKGQDLVRIEDYADCGLILTYLKDDARFSDDKNTLNIDHNSVSLYVNTIGEDDKRYFLHKDKITLSAETNKLHFQVSEIKNTGGRIKHERAWLVLYPCVPMDSTERIRIDTELKKEAESHIGQVQDRLQRGESYLAGAEITSRSGWCLEDGLLCPTEKRLAETDAAKRVVTLYPTIKGRGTSRYFPVPKTEDSEEGVLDADTPNKIQLEATAALKIYPLEIFTSRKRKRALVEVIEVVDASQVTDNQAEIDKIRMENEKRRMFVDKLKSGKVLDLVAEGLSLEQRAVGRESIGKLGKIPGQSKQATGIHFEVFSGVNLVDDSVNGKNRELVNVPKSHWVVFRDEAKDDVYTSGFVKRMMESLLKVPGIDHKAKLLPQDAVESRVPTPKEWVEFCKANRRALSCVIAAHPPEWALDWDSLLDSNDSRGKHIAVTRRDALKKELKDFSWWKDSLKLEGINDKVMFFYHPLRLLEWLSTGIDLGISGGQSAKVAVRIKGRDDVILEYDKAVDGFRFRTVIGEKRHIMDATLVLEGVETANPELLVQLRRGEVTQIRLSKPSVSLMMVRDQPNIRYLVPVIQKGVSGAPYLLADGNAKLSNAGYSRASFRIEVRYVLEMPDSVSVELSGSGFELSQYDVQGGRPKARKEEKTVVELNLEPEIAPSKYVRGTRSFAIDINVVANDKAGTEAKLEVTVSGGDLKSPKKVISDPIRKRKIRRSKKKSERRGEDVAKVQLYLSQIHERDLPCYRYGGGKREYGEKNVKAVIIDGDYGMALARGLWRFIYHYVSSSSRWKASHIRVTDVAGQKEERIACSELDLPLVLAEDEPEMVTMEERLETPKEYPIVDQPLLKEIINHFRAPFVVPRVTIKAIDTHINKTGKGGYPIEIEKGWKHTTTILPVEDTIQLDISSNELQRIGGNLDVKLEVSDASAYRLWDGSASVISLTKSLKEVCEKRIWKLVPSGNLTVKQQENVLLVKTMEGKRIGGLVLAGARNLSKVQGGKFRDAAILQFWLSQIPDDPAGSTRPCLQMKRKNTIDGNWGRASIKALARFKKAYGEQNTFTELVTAMKKIYEKFKDVEPPEEKTVK